MAKVEDPAPRPGFVRRVGRAVSNVPGAGLAFVPPRTARFAVGTWLRHNVRHTDGPPDPALSWQLTAQVALDEMLLGYMKSPRRFPANGDYATVARELEEAAALYTRRGFVDAPATYHVAPKAIEPRITRGRSPTLAFERLAWPSGYRPHEGEPGRERWMGYERNRTAHAWVLRGDPARPWLVCLHGFGTGQPVSDFYAFRARRLHRELGLNLLFPVLPIHGPRRVSRMGGAELMSHELQNFVLGMAQSMYDIRGLIAWARGEGAGRVGVYGMSLGAYVAALLATLEPGLEFVLAGAPLCDIPDLFEHHSTATLRRRVDPKGTVGETARVVHRVISPLAAPPLLPPERLAIFAGLGDRMAPPSQATRLWEHWGQPRIAWYEGSHITFLWSGTVAAFIDDTLKENGFIRRRTPRPAPTAPPAAGRREPGRRPARS
ncbi:MAG: alpha/beta hydrolase family protein [Actinobacteria bacterium]|nr:alpha/beta hydrolase family protein [Actinomycetota bacterium]